MDSVSIALGFAIVVVLILLMTCFKNKHPKTKKKRQVLPSTATSEYGTGVVNEEFNKRHDNLLRVDGYDDYTQLAQYMSVDPEVYESHARYTADMNRSTSGPSMLPERDDPNDVVPWVGMRRIDYNVPRSKDTTTTNSEEDNSLLSDYVKFKF